MHLRKAERSGTGTEHSLSARWTWRVRLVRAARLVRFQRDRPFLNIKGAASGRARTPLHNVQSRIGERARRVADRGEVVLGSIL